MMLNLPNGIFAKHTIEDNTAIIRSLGFENIELNMKSVEKQEDDSPIPAKKSSQFQRSQLPHPPCCITARIERERKKS